MDDFQLFDTIRAEIQAEHTLISHRLGWYVGAMSLLMTAFAIALSGGHTRARFFAVGMPILGLLLSVMALCAIVPAVVVQADLLQTQKAAVNAARDRLKAEGDQGKAKVARLDDYAKVTCPERQSGFSTHWVAMSAPIAIPVVFLAAWVFACFHYGQSPGQASTPGRFIVVPASGTDGKARVVDTATGRIITEGDPEFGKALIP